MSDAPPPYSGPIAVCVKCGNVGAFTLHMSGEGREWLRRACERCMYHWREATVDFTQAAWDTRATAAII